VRQLVHSFDTTGVVTDGDVRSFDGRIFAGFDGGGLFQIAIAICRLQLIFWDVLTEHLRTLRAVERSRVAWGGSQLLSRSSLDVKPHPQLGAPPSTQVGQHVNACAQAPPSHASVGCGQPPSSAQVSSQGGHSTVCQHQQWHLADTCRLWPGCGRK